MINWQFPPVRHGLAGLVDKFVGPGATRAELMLQLFVPLAAAGAAPLYALGLRDVEWSLAQSVMASILAFDVVGGVITNATSSAKRWYHRQGQGPAELFGFVSLHMLHLLIISVLYLGYDMSWVFVTAGYLIASAVGILSVPLYLQRPVGLLTYIGALLLTLTALPQPTGLEWFLPLFYLKLLVSHLPKEEPYRPESEVLRHSA